MDANPPSDAPARLTHLDQSGAARMVDVGAKPESDRVAKARATVRMSPSTAETVEAGNAPKGDVVGSARIAGVLAAKRAAELIPLAHPLPLNFIDVAISIDADAGTVTIEAEARTHAKTGVEIEAMTACSVAALTVYDMVKGVERGVTIDRVELIEKTGGKEDWHKPEGAAS